MKKTKDAKEPAYTSLAIRKTEDEQFVLISHQHAADGTVLDIQEQSPTPFHLVVHEMKLAASRLWRP